MSTRMSDLFVIGVGILVCLLLQCEAYYTVGGAEGWRADPSITDWPKDMSFKAGDVLFFKYSSEDLGVVALTNSDAYKNCNIILDLTRTFHGSGNDLVVLQQGTIYFVAITKAYCIKGAKMMIDVK
ncbi:hypothetical protein PRUPE_6G288900 [Prunus persica]|uniref:Phytocyanin domain-containing protein n=1 Tax=Prunus persica TaxID=3760 RepID=A0A251NX65_PRUPE|nr:hypothetical protein PRUPE_6G288900 [Prunus persica]